MEDKINNLSFIMTAKEIFKKRKFIIAVLIVASFISYVVALFTVEIPDKNRDLVAAAGGVLSTIVVLTAKEFFDGRPDDALPMPNKPKPLGE